MAKAFGSVAAIVAASTAFAAPSNLKVPEGTGVTAAVQKDSVRPGEIVAVDVYLSKIPDVGAYQVRLEVTGGTTGSLMVEEAKLDRSREDYVFGTDEIVDASNTQKDLKTALVGAVKSSGGAAVEAPAYGGTIYYKASDDASGTFTIKVQIGPSSTMMTDSMAREIPVTAGQAATVNVSKTPKRVRSQDK